MSRTLRHISASSGKKEEELSRLRRLVSDQKQVILRLERVIRDLQKVIDNKGYKIKPEKVKPEEKKISKELKKEQDFEEFRRKLIEQVRSKPKPDNIPD